MTTLSSGHTIVYSGNPNKDDFHDKGVGFMLTKKAARALLEWNPVSPRIISARFNTKFQKTTIIQVYAPTNNADEDEKEDFYFSLQAIVNTVPKRDILLIMGDLNAKVGSERLGRESEIGPHGIGTMNENGELFADFCAVNSMVIGGTFFPHKTCHKTTWVSPTGDTENQIDHIAIARRWRSSLHDVRAKRGADISSDHHLLVAEIRLKILAQKRSELKRRKFNTGRLKDTDIANEFQLSLQNRFSVLQQLNGDEEDINSTWEHTKDAIISTCEETLGYIQHNRKQWISEKTWETICERRQDKERILNATTRQQKGRQQNSMQKETKK